MTCFNTTYAWRADKPNDNGKFPLEFNAQKSILDESCLEVPCGRCLGCQSDKARIWSIRMYHEMQMHDRNSFVTLTYRDSSQKVIDKDHLQRFFKRMRHHGYKFRYFSCAEYGDQTRRPHYHIVFFGEDFLGGSYRLSEDLWGNKILEMIWGEGLVACGRVTMDSIKYVAGYVQKKIGDRDESFSLMSRKPGLGKGWLEKYKRELISNGFVVIDGVKLDIPVQYMKWYEHEFEEVKEKRKEKVRRFTSDQLAAKKANLKAKLGLKGTKI